MLGFIWVQLYHCFGKDETTSWSPLWPHVVECCTKPVASPLATQTRAQICVSARFRWRLFETDMADHIWSTIGCSLVQHADQR